MGTTASEINPPVALPQGFVRYKMRCVTNDFSVVMAAKIRVAVALLSALLID
jgi:hypothetical protein